MPKIQSEVFLYVMLRKTAKIIKFNLETKDVKKAIRFKNKFIKVLSSIPGHSLLMMYWMPTINDIQRNMGSSSGRKITEGR
ncbi:MAG: hypothetical protein SCALA702_35840 [Melioribacteraceae bacterium]|nr:MAG: hypothetical protein SCALA702_35840 [Melioribacteraceae bacterium]